MSTERTPTNGPLADVTLPSSTDSMAEDRWTGTTVGKYRILRRLGKGGVGVVYEAIDSILERTVAVKMLREGFADKPDSVRKFLKEARTAARLNHPHVVSVFEANFDEEKGICYLVMELMEGGSEYDRILQSGPFAWVEATQVVMDACRGLAAVHSAGLIHRDVKPSNIMRAGDGKVKVTDFGLAYGREGESGSRSPKEQVVGTPLYMSPEQCQGKKIDKRTDIYALGATYYTLLTGRPPFEGKSALEIMNGHCLQPIPNVCAVNPNVPKACADLIAHAMDKNLEVRPADAEVMLKDLDAILALATTPDIPRVTWSGTAARNISGASTMVEPITPMVLRPANEIVRTRIWFVIACMILIGFAFWLGWNASQNPNGNPTGAELAKEEEKPLPKSDPGVRDNVAKAGVTMIETGGPVTSLAFDPRDKTRIAWGTSNGERKIYSWPDHRELHVISIARAIDPSIQQICYWHTDKVCEWVNLSEGRLHFFNADFYTPISRATNITGVSDRKITSFAHVANRGLLALAFKEDKSPEGGVLLRAFQDEQLRNALIQMEDKQPPLCVALSPDGKWLLAAREGGIVSVMAISGVESTTENLTLSQPTSTKVGYGKIVGMVGLEGSRFAVAVGMQLWQFDAATGAKIDKSGDVNVVDPAPFHQGKQRLTALAICPIGKKLACAAGDTVFVYEVDGGKLIGEFKLPSAEVRALAFNRDGSHLGYGGDRKIAIRLLKD